MDPASIVSRKVFHRDTRHTLPRRQLAIWRDPRNGASLEMFIYQPWAYDTRGRRGSGRKGEGVKAKELNKGIDNVLEEEFGERLAAGGGRGGEGSRSQIVA